LSRGTLGQTFGTGVGPGSVPCRSVLLRQAARGHTKGFDGLSVGRGECFMNEFLHRLNVEKMIYGVMGSQIVY